MPANFTIKRNALSSTWNVWQTGGDGISSIESLVAELKSLEQAERYCAMAETGKSHESIMASFEGSAGSGGLFGRFFRRKSSHASVAAEAPVINPVVEIAPSEVASEAPPAAEQVAETPSKFQVIEPAANSVLEPQEIEEPAESPDSAEAVEVADSPAVVLNDDVDSQNVSPSGKPSSFGSRLKGVFRRRSEEEEAAFETQPVSQFEPTAQFTEPPTEVKDIPEPSPVIDAPSSESNVSNLEIESEPALPEVEVDESEELYFDEVPAAPVNEEPAEDAATATLEETEAPEPLPSIANVSQQDDDPVFEPEESLDLGEEIDETPAAVFSEPETEITPVPVAEVQTEASQPSAPDSVGPLPGGPLSHARSEAMADRFGLDTTAENPIPPAVQQAAFGDPRVSDRKFSKAASQEYTEVSKVFAAGNSPEKLREELLHLASVCLAWANSIEMREAERSQRRVV